MMRAYGADVGFDVIDETGEIVDRVTLPKGRTVIAQYRAPPGTCRVRFFDDEVVVKTRAGQFVAYGVAVTRVPANDGKESVWPSYSPFASYTPIAMERRVAPLAALGRTDFLPRKKLGASTLKFLMTAQ
jgi:hypothetical protein